MMADVVYKKSFYDRLCRTVVGLGLMYGCFYGGKSWVEYKQSRMPYQIMKIKDRFMLVDNGSDKMIEVKKGLFEGLEERLR